jgi:hypothetical protein
MGDPNDFMGDPGGFVGFHNGLAGVPHGDIQGTEGARPCETLYLSNKQEEMTYICCSVASSSPMN